MEREWPEQPLQVVMAELEGVEVQQLVGGPEEGRSQEELEMERERPEQPLQVVMAELEEVEVQQLVGGPGEGRSQEEVEKYAGGDAGSGMVRFRG
jgi:hypothetical protein